MEQQVNLVIGFTQILTGPQQKTALSSLCCPLAMIFSPLRVLLTSIFIQGPQSIFTKLPPSLWKEFSP